MATEWEEIQMRMGNIPYREIPKPMTASIRFPLYTFEFVSDAILQRSMMIKLQKTERRKRRVLYSYVLIPLSIQTELQQQLEKASLDELNEIEDDFDDEAILEQYR